MNDILLELTKVVIPLFFYSGYLAHVASKYFPDAVSLAIQQVVKDIFYAYT
jgi:hypothetical protein